MASPAVSGFSPVPGDWPGHDRPECSLIIGPPGQQRALWLAAASRGHCVHVHQAGEGWRGRGPVCCDTNHQPVTACMTPGYPSTSSSPRSVKLVSGECCRHPPPLSSWPTKDSWTNRTFWVDQMSLLVILQCPDYKQSYIFNDLNLCKLPSETPSIINEFTFTYNNNNSLQFVCTFTQ